jgi:hypothetical protein
MPLSSRRMPSSGSSCISTSATKELVEAPVAHYGCCGHLATRAPVLRSRRRRVRARHTQVLHPTARTGGCPKVRQKPALLQTQSRIDRCGAALGSTQREWGTYAQLGAPLLIANRSTPPPASFR